MVASTALSEHLASLALSPARPLPSSSSTPRKVAAAVDTEATPTPDLSLPTAVTALVHHLTLPLAPLYPHSTLTSLRAALRTRLSDLFAPSWRPDEPSAGSGTRSLICLRRSGLPAALRAAVKDVDAGVDERAWVRALARSGNRERDGEVAGSSLAHVRRLDEWEAWCDPGMVAIRHGPWEWYDAEFDPVRSYREPIITIWQASPTTSPTLSSGELAGVGVSHTPARPNAAIPIRAPTLFAIPPTPSSQRIGAAHGAQPGSPSPIHTLMPAAQIGHVRAASTSATLASRSPSPSVDADGDAEHPRHARATTYPHARGHAGGYRSSSGSSSMSTSSSISDATTGNTQLLTPGYRPSSADPFGPKAQPRVAGEDEHEDADADEMKDAFGASGKEQQTPSDVTVTPTPGARGRVTSASSNAADDKAATTASTPTITPYDGGNVTVLGGGVKLGGGGGASRAGSVISQHRLPLDRARSPSISLANRALHTALSPHEGGAGAGAGGGGGGGRKPRTRRRIMPTYLGYVGQPGVGGPVGSAFAGAPPTGVQGKGAAAYGVPHAQGGMQSFGMGMGMGMGVGVQGMQQPLAVGMMGSGNGQMMAPQWGQQRMPLQRLA